MLRVLAPNRKSDCCGVPNLCGIMVLHMCAVTIHSEEWEKLGAWNLILAFMYPQNLQKCTCTTRPPSVWYLEAFHLKW